MSTVTLSACPACGTEAWSERERWNGYVLADCNRCRLTFTVNPDYTASRYVAAYAQTNGGPVPDERLHIYGLPERRLALERRALAVPPPRLTPAEKLALRWIGERVGREERVVDCGCGTGRFLRALAANGLEARGFELSPALVAALVDAGLPAAEGAAPDFPWDGPPPAAITFFEVLEHLPEPAAVLGPLRERFPEAAILASVPSPRRRALLRGRRGLADYPPNHFLRWTPEALRSCFAGLGYAEVVVVLPRPTGAELVPGFGVLASRLRRGGGPSVAGGSRPVRKPSGRLAATAALFAHSAYQVTTTTLAAPGAELWRRRGASADSMLVIAVP